MSVKRGKLLRISSEDKKESDSNGNFSVNLGNSSYVQNIIGVVLKSVSFKHVFPNVFEGNQEFTFLYNGFSLTATVPVAWYNATEYIAELQTQINALPAVLNLITVSFIDSPSTTSLNKYFTLTASGGDTVALVNKADGNAAADLTGTTVSTALNTVVTADSLPDFGGLSEIYLCSGALAGYNTTASSNNGEVVPVVTEIPINVPFGQQVYYRANEGDLESIIYSNLRSFTNIDIQLCTRNGTLLNTAQHPITIVFKLLHDNKWPSD